MTAKEKERISIASHNCQKLPSSNLNIYIYEPLLAPTQELFVYKRQKGQWSEYEQRFFALLRDRRIEERVDQKVFDIPTVLLCSEATAEYCHRRLIIEYLQSQWGNIKAIHL